MMQLVPHTHIRQYNENIVAACGRFREGSEKKVVLPWVKVENQTRSGSSSLELSSFGQPDCVQLHVCGAHATREAYACARRHLITNISLISLLIKLI